MAHVKVDNVFGIGALHGDGEGLEGMEGERDQSPDSVVNGSAQQACLDLKFQQSRVPRVEPAGGGKKAVAVYYDGKWHGDSKKPEYFTA